MSGDAVALRLDDVGAASKQHEVYGVTRIPLGPLRAPVPGQSALPQVPAADQALGTLSGADRRRSGRRS